MSRSNNSGPVATPSDVRERLNLPDPQSEQGIEVSSGISDSEIETYLADANFEIRQAADTEEIDNELQRRLEWRLAAIEILSHRQGSRETQQESIGSLSRSYASSSIGELKEWVKRHGPDGLVDDHDEFWSASIQG